ncbi:hydrolase [Sphingomonas antarctica]|uniref:hydrolase n=1 Tax=Sphingomonas antarctica TaxID=2040274 RepID=UPI0039EAE468
MTMNPPALTQIACHEIGSLLDRFPDMEVLSLDCFDTLLWRRGQAPRDVFCDLPIKGGAIQRRMAAEGKMRHARGCEVTLEEIYGALMPSADANARFAAMQAELDAEAAPCFAYEPVVQLLEAAKARGLMTMIVSDTYLNAGQLIDLIERAGGERVIALVDNIFCSSDYGMPKAGGLFAPVLDQLGIAAGKILHLGDNRIADHDAPRKLGILGVHLRQFTHAQETQLRLEAAAATLADPAVRGVKPAFQPHRPALALRPDMDDAGALGFDVIGPVLTAFDRWLETEEAKLAAETGRPVKTVYLLRDGHLPGLVREARSGAKPLYASISRFTARRGGLADPAALERYIDAEQHRRFEVHADQLQLSPRERKEMGDSLTSMAAYLRQDDVAAKVQKRGSLFLDRIVKHLRRAGVERGDAVMFVDLGYNGTVQNEIAALLSERAGVHVAGRYLLLRENDVSGLDKAGFIGTDDYDDAFLLALTRSVSALEQLVTSGLGTVTDYRDDGRGIFSAARDHKRQQQVRGDVQAACLTYARVAGDADMAAERQAAAASLTRFLFLPSAAESALLATFAHDVNLGTRDTNKLLDSNTAKQDLRRNGLRYAGTTDRLFPSAELCGERFDLALAHFAQQRFGLELRDADVRRNALSVPCIVASGSDQTLVDLDAWPTHDGFFKVTVPLGTGGLQAGILLGRIARHVEVESVMLTTLKELERDNGDGATLLTPVYDGVERLSDALFACSANGLMLVSAPASGEAVAAEIVFRPIGSPAVELRLAA